MLLIIALALGGYLLGSIPVGFLVGRAKGVDLRTLGSGNLGATNVYRAFGFKVAVTVFALDLAKGFVGTRVLPFLWTGDIGVQWVRLICGISVIVGSVASIYMRFRGGKGVATSVGVFLGLAPLATLICLGVWAALFTKYRYVSLGSMVGAACLPVLIALLRLEGFARDPVFYLALLVAAVVVLRHRSNIRRLLDGTENRIGGKRGEHAG
jgi:glycerol-3-phosphate acyltransferase PlsY